MWANPAQPCLLPPIHQEPYRRRNMNPTMQEEEEARPSKKARPDPAAGSGLTPFALRLAKQLSNSKGKGDNLVFSPLSVYAALALLAAGARGETLDELLALLGASSREELAEFARGAAERALADRSGSGGPLVAFACGVWHAETAAPKFKFSLFSKMNDVLRDMGLRASFDEHKADLSDMLEDDGGMFVENVFHELSCH